MPLIIEGNKRGVISKIFIRKNAKYNNPYKYRDVLGNFAKLYGFYIYDLSEVNAHPQLTFLVEGCGIEAIQYSNKKICLVYMTDFRHLYEKYIHKVDHVIFPSLKYAEFHNTLSSKNLYLGSPKYDLKFNKKQILEKYSLTDNKKCVILYPRKKDMHLINLKTIYEEIRSHGYELLVKTRGKDPVSSGIHRGDRYFVDESWFPHTSMELMYISDFVVNFDSTSIEEGIMLSKPILNFNIKGGSRGATNSMPFLMEFPFCHKMNRKYTPHELTEGIKFLIDNNFYKNFKECRERFLLEGNISRNILDTFERELGE